MDGVKGTTLARIFLAYNNSGDSSSTGKSQNVNNASSSAAVNAKQEAVKVNGESNLDSVDSRRARVSELKAEYLQKGDSMANNYSSKDVALSVEQSLFS